jgi:hypothetical protein
MDLIFLVYLYFGLQVAFRLISLADEVIDGTRQGVLQDFVLSLHVFGKPI